MKKTRGKPKGKKARKAGETTPSQTRLEGAAVAVHHAKKGSGIADLVKAADERYVATGGRSNLRESNWAVSKAVAVLRAAGLIRVEAGKVEVIGKVTPIEV